MLRHIVGRNLTFKEYGSERRLDLFKTTHGKLLLRPMIEVNFQQRHVFLK